jgi:hypothetical protein
LHASTDTSDNQARRLPVKIEGSKQRFFEAEDLFFPTPCAAKIALLFQVLIAWIDLFDP